MLTRWSPFRDIIALQDEINHAFRRFPQTDDKEGTELYSREGSWMPIVDIYEDVEGITAKFELAGVDPSEVELKVDENVFTLRGERKLENEERRDNYYRIERSYGAFSRSFNLPDTVDVEKIQAESKHGVLSVFFPKKPEAQPKQITISVKNLES